MMGPGAAVPSQEGERTVFVTVKQGMGRSYPGRFMSGKRRRSLGGETEPAGDPGLKKNAPRRLGATFGAPFQSFPRIPDPLPDLLLQPPEIQYPVRVELPPYLAELPCHAATASGRAVGGRDLPTECSQQLRDDRVP